MYDFNKITKLIINYIAIKYQTLITDVQRDNPKIKSYKIYLNNNEVINTIKRMHFIQNLIPNILINYTKETYFDHITILKIKIDFSNVSQEDMLNINTVLRLYQIDVNI